MKVYTKVPVYGYQQDEEVEVYSISQPDWNEKIDAFWRPFFLIWDKDAHKWVWASSLFFQPSPSWEEQ